MKTNFKPITSGFLRVHSKKNQPYLCPNLPPSFVKIYSFIIIWIILVKNNQTNGRENKKGPKSEQRLQQQDVLYAEWNN